MKELQLVTETTDNVLLILTFTQVKILITFYKCLHTKLTMQQKVSNFSYQVPRYLLVLKRTVEPWTSFLKVRDLLGSLVWIQEVST